MTALVVRGGSVLTPDGIMTADVLSVDGRIDRIGTVRAVPAGAVDVDASGLLVAPGFVDIQINGAYGVDLATAPEDLPALAAALPRHGVTAFCPTIVSSPAVTVGRALAALGAGVGPASALPLGLHLEGPMLNPARRGAHDPAALRPPSVSVIDGWSRASGVALVTLAPELPGAADVIRALRERGVVVSAGHTDATAAEMDDGVDGGITAVTHLFNAMRPFGHRDPGPIGVALTDDRVVAGLIPDGVHADPIAVALAWRAKGPDGIALVTDAVAALGSPPRPSRLGSLDVTVTRDSVRLADGTLAGSMLSMDDAVRNVVVFTGCPPADAIRASATTPARLLGDADRGVLETGRRADMVLLTRELRVAVTIVDGTVAWRS